MFLLIAYIVFSISVVVFVWHVVRSSRKKHLPGNPPVPPADGRHVERLHGSGEAFVKSGKGWLHVDG